MVERELASLPPELAPALAREQLLWSIVYMPQLGFVVRVEGGRLPRSVEARLPPGYEFAFEGSGALAEVWAWGGGGGGGGGGLACVPARMQPNPQSPLAHTHNRSPLPATPTRARQEGLGAHYRCPATHQLNERFGDLLPRIQASGCGGEGGTRGRAIAHPLHPANC